MQLLIALVLFVGALVGTAVYLLIEMTVAAGDQSRRRVRVTQRVVNAIGWRLQRRRR